MLESATHTRRKKNEDEDKPAMDMADASHAVKFRHPTIRNWAHDVNVR